jgi:hypothetical protein
MKKIGKKTFNSKKQENICKTNDLSRLSAAKHFAKVKNLPLK